MDIFCTLPKCAKSLKEIIIIWWKCINHVQNCLYQPVYWEAVWINQLVTPTQASIFFFLGCFVLFWIVLKPFLTFYYKNFNYVSVKNSLTNPPIAITHIQWLGIHGLCCFMHNLPPSPTNSGIISSINMSMCISKRQE